MTGFDSAVLSRQFQLSYLLELVNTEEAKILYLSLVFNSTHSKPEVSSEASQMFLLNTLCSETKQLRRL